MKRGEKKTWGTRRVWSASCCCCRFCLSLLSLMVVVAAVVVERSSGEGAGGAGGCLCWYLLLTMTCYVSRTCCCRCNGAVKPVKPVMVLVAAIVVKLWSWWRCLLMQPAWRWWLCCLFVVDASLLLYRQHQPPPSDLTMTGRSGNNNNRRPRRVRRKGVRMEDSETRTTPVMFPTFRLGSTSESRFILGRHPPGTPREPLALIQAYHWSL